MLAALPTLNASLNATSAIFLTGGFVFIKRRQILYHKICMLIAFFASAIFLISYVTYHATHGPTHFLGTGIMRKIYFSLLIFHSTLAVAAVPAALVTLRLAFQNNFDRHKTWARITWPLWMIVSVTGVMVYCFLYL